MVASEQDRPDVARRRAQWLKFQPRIDPSRLVFIDETWTKTNMAPLRGWAPRGQRLPGKAPFGHWNTMTFLAALRHDRVEAPWLIKGPINGQRLMLKSVTAVLTEAAPIDTKFDVFLSHSSDEPEKTLRGVKDYLEEYNLTVYVDKYGDPDMSPNEVTPETATRLRWRLANSGALIYVHSRNSTMSRWMPWELGFMDGRSGKIGVLPVTQRSNSTFQGEEYLSLYPYIDKMTSGSDKEYFWINESSDRYARLDLWAHHPSVSSNKLLTAGICM